MTKENSEEIQKSAGEKHKNAFFSRLSNDFYVVNVDHRGIVHRYCVSGRYLWEEAFDMSDALYFDEETGKLEHDGLFHVVADRDAIDYAVEILGRNSQRFFAGNKKEADRIARKHDR